MHELHRVALHGFIYLPITQHPLQILTDPFRRLPIPQRRDCPFLPLISHQARECGRKLGRISSDQFVGPDGDGFRSFGVVPKDRAILRIAVSPEVFFLYRLLQIPAQLSCVRSSHRLGRVSCGRPWTVGRSSMQHTLNADILIDIRPMNPLTVAKDLPMLSLLLGSIHQPP